ncbi:hypothetical protein ACX801_08030 [Arthrobacter bambusae]
MRHWKITTTPNLAARDQTPHRVSEQAEEALDRICDYLQSRGQLVLPDFMAEGEPPMDVSVSASGRYAGAKGALFTWCDENIVLWRGWIREDGSVGRVEQDVIDKDSDDPMEIESHWARQPATEALIRVKATGAKARPFGVGID